MAEKKTSAEATVKNIRRRTRRKYSAEEKIRIVIEGSRGESTIAELSNSSLTRYSFSPRGMNRSRRFSIGKTILMIQYSMIELNSMNICCQYTFMK